MQESEPRAPHAEKCQAGKLMRSLPGQHASTPDDVKPAQAGQLLGATTTVMEQLSQLLSRGTWLLHRIDQ
jgi:hypothetical protein